MAGPFLAFLGFDSVGPGELLVLFAVTLVVVGPKGLPRAARKLGSILATIRRAADEFKRQIMSMDVGDESPSTSASGPSQPPPPPASGNYIEMPASYRMEDPVAAPVDEGAAVAPSEPDRAEKPVAEGAPE